MVDLVNHRRLDLELLLLAYLVGDVLDKDERTRAAVAVSAPPPEPAAAACAQQRNYLLDPDYILLFDPLLQTLAVLHRLEADILVGVEIRQQRINEILHVAEPEIHILGHSADVADDAPLVDHQDPVVQLQAADALRAPHPPLQYQVAELGDRAPELPGLLPLALMLGHRHLALQHADNGPRWAEDREEFLHGRRATDERPADDGVSAALAQQALEQRRAVTAIPSPHQGRGMQRRHRGRGRVREHHRLSTRVVADDAAVRVGHVGQQRQRADDALQVLLILQRQAGRERQRLLHRGTGARWRVCRVPLYAPEAPRTCLPATSPGER